MRERPQAPVVRGLGLALLALIVLFTTAGSAAARPVRHAAGAVKQRDRRAVCGSVNPGFARCHAQVVTNSGGTPLASSGPSGYAPSDLLSAYNLASAAATGGSGQTVALVDAYDDPNAESDLGVYRSQYGLSPCTTANGCFKKVNQTGGTSYPSHNTGWSEEISLDLDMVSAICPNCHILLVEASSNSFTNLSTAENEAATLGATEISNSYGGSEYSGETSAQSAYNHPGIAITASSGDNGYGVEFPASSQYVTAVGGTTLTHDSSARTWAESAWADAGSGCSAYIAKPSWQTDSGCSQRTVADVSAVADPNTGVAVYDSYNESGWLVFGGTSVASPIIASYYAIVGGGAGDGNGSYAYQHPSWFYDITSGSNGSCGGSYLCTAGPGYDGPTGIGTPDGATHPPVVSTGSASGVTSSGATLTGSVNPNGQATTYHFDYGTGTGYGSQIPLPPDPSAGSGTTSQSVSATLSNLSPSTPYHYRIEATNASGTTYGADQTFTTGPPTVTVGTPSGPTTAPQGNWVGNYGNTGYAIVWSNSNNSIVSVPNYISWGNVQAAGLTIWQSGTSDPRALESPDQSTRTAAAAYDPNQIVIPATFNSAFNGNLEFYVLDWDSQGRRETIAINGVQANINSDFSQGAWVSFPVNIQAGGSITITITRTAGPNAVLSGFFLN